MDVNEIGRPTFLGGELRAAELGDERLSKRLSTLVDSLAASPASSFPVAARDEAELEATYRFFGNEKVAPKSILAPHIRATVDRAVECGSVLVAHDTTQFNFGLFAREGLGRVGRGKSFGFYGHFALAIARDGTRLPLGVLGLETMARPLQKRRRLKHGKNQANPENESLRWRRLMERTHEALGGRASAVHVMDREGDNYALLSRMVELKCRFVVRLYRDRKLRAPEGPVSVLAALEGSEVLAEREVPISARRRQEMPSYRKRHPPRSSRIAKLRISAEPVTIPRPATSSESPHPSLTLNLVRVLESDTPPNVEPVEWWLWTTEPIQTAADVLAVVDAYRGRWVIEEYFKALKTGCAYEKRQLESVRALLNALAVLAPIAWRLLVLRRIAREHADTPASAALSPIQLKCLRFAYRKRRKRELPKKPTVRDAMLAVAALGGHIANNGDPGWQVLGRGFDTLLTIVEGYLLAAG